MGHGKIFLVDWDDAAARERAAALRRKGWQVEVESEDGHRAYRLVRGQPPDVLVVSLRTRPSHGRETARSLVGRARLDALRIVFVDGADRDRQAAAEVVPGAIFTTGDELEVTLERATAACAG